MWLNTVLRSLNGIASVGFCVCGAEDNGAM